MVAGGRPARGFGLPQDPFAERLDLGALAGRRGGDEAAAFGRLGLAVEDGHQRSALQLPRDQHRASDGDPEPVDGGLYQHAVEAEARGPRQVGRGLALAGEPVGPVGVPSEVVEQRPVGVQVGRTAGPAARREQGGAADGWNTEEFFETATVDVVTACLAAGADVAARDDDRNAPLHWAAWSSTHPAVIEALLVAGADLQARREDGRTALHNGAWNNESPAVIEALLAAGADLEAPNSDDGGGTALAYAANRNETLAVFQTLAAAGADLGWRSTVGHTLAHAAARNENPAMMEWLLEAGVDPEATTNGGETPLHRAALYNQNPAVVEALLAAGADIEARDDDGFTPLHRAAQRQENLAVLEALLAAGADVGASTDNGLTPLDFALGRGNRATLATLVEALVAAGNCLRGLLTEHGAVMPRGRAPE